MLKARSLSLGKIDRLILFGGGELLVNIAREARSQGISVFVFAAKRHLAEMISVKSRLTLSQALQEIRVQFYSVKDINKSARLKSLITKSALGIGLGEAYTFSDQTISLFGNKIFDFMVIPLPCYRGGAHFTWQILRHDKMGAWNIQVINKDMVPGVYDSGGIIKTRKYAIPLSARIPQDYFDLAHREGLEIFLDFIREIKAGKNFSVTPVNETGSTYYPRLFTAIHGFINWSWNADQIERFICAFDDPYCGASTFIDGKRVYLKNCKIVRSAGSFHPFMSGLIYRTCNDKVFAACCDHALEVKRIVDDKGKSVLESIRPGERFYTPAKFLEQAMLFNADYNTEGLTRKA